MHLSKINESLITNDNGQPVVLNAREKFIANYWERKIKNSLGYEIPITTLTTIIKKITEQKFFEIAPADYLPVRVGEGAWSTNLVTYRSYLLSSNFEDGIVNLGANNSRLAAADAGVDSVTVQIMNWAKTIGWSIMDLEIAAKSGNWDLVTAKEKARKKDWDLGIQRVAFLGASGLNYAGGPVLGLYNQAGIANNTNVITMSISQMSPAQLKVFCYQVVEAYRENNQRTAWPTHFIIPESDYNGLASQASPDFPIKSTLELLEEMFQTICRNKQFRILPNAYGDNQYHLGVQPINGYQIYVLLNYDEESVRMDIPVDYTNTTANSLDNFMFQTVGYGQWTGVQTYRPLELLYFTFPA